MGQGSARAYLVDPLKMLGQLDGVYFAADERKRMYLDFLQIGPMGLLRRLQIGDPLDVWRRHFATARR